MTSNRSRHLGSSRRGYPATIRKRKALLNDFVQTYTINVYDPRSTISEVRIANQPVPLHAIGSYYTTPNSIIVIRQAEAPLLAADADVELEQTYVRPHHAIKVSSCRMIHWPVLRPGA